MKTIEELEREIDRRDRMILKLKEALTKALNHIAAENTKRKAAELQTKEDKAA